jgi:hypothetical protein
MPIIMRTILIIALIFFQGQDNPKKYLNKEYGFSISLPTTTEAKKQDIDAGFAKISRIRIVADTQQVSGLSTTSLIELLEKYLHQLASLTIQPFIKK